MKKVLIFISVVIVLLITIVYIINDIETIYNKNLIKENEICYAGFPRSTSPLVECIITYKHTKQKYKTVSKLIV